MPDQKSPFANELLKGQVCRRSVAAAFDNAARIAFESIEHRRLRVGTMALKIAAICIAHDARLLSRKLVDFEKVPGLRVENRRD